MKITILCGIPCSGKSSWAYKDSPVKDIIISRDMIRELKFGKGYKQNYKDEKIITKIFDEEVNDWLSRDYNVIMDNCHTREKYIDGVIAKYPEHSIYIKFFECSLRKALLRNVLRFIKEGKWIPVKVIKAMHKNFKKINKDKYAKYMV